MSLRLICIILCIPLFLSCQKKSGREEGSVERAYKLIDADREEEAIVLLEEEYNKDPKNKPIKVALASAYAKRAGITLEAFYDLLNYKVFSKPLGESGLSSELNSSGLKTNSAYSRQGKTVNEATQSIAKIMGLALDAAKTFYYLPNIDPERRLDLYQAIYHMNTLEDKTKGEHLYLAILKILELKFVLYNDILPSMFVQSNNKCRLDVESTKKGVHQLADILFSIIDNINGSHPIATQEIYKNKSAIKEELKTLDANLSEALLFDDFMILLFKQAVIATGVGDFNPCGL